MYSNQWPTSQVLGKCTAHSTLVNKETGPSGMAKLAPLRIKGGTGRLAPGGWLVFCVSASIVFDTRHGGPFTATYRPKAADLTGLILKNLEFSEVRSVRCLASSPPDLINERALYSPKMIVAER